MTHDPPCSHTCHLIWPWIPALLELGFFCLGFLRNSCPNYQGNSSCYLVLGGWYVFLGPPNPFVVWTLEAKLSGALGGNTWRLHRCSGHQSWHKLGGLKQDVWDLAKHPFHLGSFPNFFRWNWGWKLITVPRKFQFFLNKMKVLSYRIPY